MAILNLKESLLVTHHHTKQFSKVSNQTLKAMNVVFDHYIVPDAVTKLRNKNEFNIKVIEALRDNRYLGDVMRLVNIEKEHGYGGVDLTSLK